MVFAGIRWGGISIGPAGDYMTCAYTRETNGLFGNIKNQGLREAFERKHDLESAHYKKYGMMPCLIRDNSFSSYLERLQAEKLQVEKKEREKNLTILKYSI